MKLSKLLERLPHKILFGDPDAEILSFDRGTIHPTTYEETDSYQVTEMFLNHRRQILRRLLDENE